MLHDRAVLVRLYPLGHHIHNVVEDGCAQLQIVVALDALLGDALGDALCMAALKVARQQVAQPPLEEGHDAAKEKDPHSPHGRPEATPGPLADGPRIEAIVDEVLEVFAHADLAHQLVLVAVHACELPHVRKDVVQPIRQLVGIHVAEAKLHVRINDQLDKAQDLPAEVKGIPKAALLALLCGERLDRLEVKVVIEVEVGELFALNEQVEHVKALPADLQARLEPVQLGALKVLCLAQLRKEAPLGQRGRRLAGGEFVGHPSLEQLLVADANLDGQARRAVLSIPLLDEGHVDGAARPAALLVVRVGRPVEGDAIIRCRRIQRHPIQPRRRPWGEGKGPRAAAMGRCEEAIEGTAARRSKGRQARLFFTLHLCSAKVGGKGVAQLKEGARRDRMQRGVKVKGRHGRVFGPHLDDRGLAVGADAHAAWPAVVEKGQGDAVLCAEGSAHDDLVDVVKFVPVLLVAARLSVERFKLWPTRHGHVEGLCSEKGVQVKEVKVVLVDNLREELRGEPMQVAHDGRREVPRASADDGRLVVVEPVADGAILVAIQVHLDGVEGLDIENVIGIVEGRLLVVKGREAHALKVAPVALLPAHHGPHGGPLGDKDGLADARRLIHKGDGARHVVEDGHVAHLLPGHRHVLDQLEEGVRDVL